MADKHVHRDLDLGPGHVSGGPDVAEFKRAVARELQHRKLGFLIHFESARQARHTIARTIYALGLSERARRNALRGHVSKSTQRKIRNPARRGPLDRARAGNRRPTLREWRREHRAARVTVMYDSITLEEIPDSAPAVAGYTGGAWPTYRELDERFPEAKRLSIAIQSSEDADVLDIEPGNAEPEDAPKWVRRQIKRRAAGERYNIDRPCVYASASQMREVENRLEEAGFPRSAYYVWSAHYTHSPHICGPTTCGELPIAADGTQWTDHALGRNLDQSLLRPGFFG